MSHPDKEEFSFRNFGDLLVVKLLRSADRCRKEVGLECLDLRKRVRFCSILRTSSDQRGWHLDGEDIADIWQDTVFDIWQLAIQSRLGNVDELDGYVYTIFKRRAIDFFRRRLVRTRHCREFDPDLIGNTCNDKGEDPERIEFDWLLVDYVKALANLKRLSRTESMVTLHFVMLLLTSQTVPSPKELTASVNIERVSRNLTVLGVDAVQSAKGRAINKLRNEGTADKGGQDDR